MQCLQERKRERERETNRQTDRQTEACMINMHVAAEEINKISHTERGRRERETETERQRDRYSERDRERLIILKTSQTIKS